MNAQKLHSMATGEQKKNETNRSMMWKNTTRHVPCYKLFSIFIFVLFALEKELKWQSKPLVYTNFASKVNNVITENNNNKCTFAMHTLIIAIGVGWTLRWIRDKMVEMVSRCRWRMLFLVDAALAWVARRSRRWRVRAWRHESKLTSRKLIVAR